MTRRRSALLLVGTAAAAVLVVAIGSAWTTQSTGPAAKRKTITLTFWNGFTGPDRPALESVVRSFNKSHANIKIDMSIMPWDVFYEKLLPSYAAQKGPDIAGLASEQMPQYADRGVFASIGDVYKKGLAKDKLVASAVAAGKWKGKYYAVPMNFTTLLLYWNKGMFKRAHLPNRPPRNWSEWSKWAVKLTIDRNRDGKPEQYGYSIADHATIPMWPILIWGNGGDVVSRDGKKAMLGSASTIKAVSFWSNLVINKHISPIGLSGADADNLFLSKKAAMEVVGPWMTTGFKKAGINFGLAMVPRGPKRQVTLGTSVVMSLSSRLNSEEKAAAYTWLKYWHSKKSQITWAVGSGFPPSRTDIKPSELRRNPYVAQFAKYAGKSQFYLSNVAKFNQVNTDIFEPAIQRILNRKGTPKDVLTKASRDMQKYLK